MSETDSLKRNTRLQWLAALATLTLVVVSLPSTPLPRFAIVTPLAYFAALSVDLATAVILLANWRTSPVLRSSFVLAMAFTSSAFLLLGAMLLLQLLPSVPAVVEGPTRAGEWLFILWHTVVALGAFAYLAVRAGDRIASRRYALGATVTTLGVTACAFLVAFILGARLPPLAATTSLAGIVSTGVGPFVAAFLALASLLAFRIQEPTEIDRAYAFSILFLCIELSVLLIEANRYSAIFFSGRLLVLAGAMLVLVAAQRTLIASRSRLLEVEWTLGRVEGESTKRAGRIRAVWQIASYAETSDVEDFGTILEIAAVALRPGKAFVGLLCHLDGDMLVIDATSSSAFESSLPAAARSLFPGASFSAERTMAHLLVGCERARAWDDFVLAAKSSTVAEDLGFRSFIGSPIPTDQGSYFVTFTSPSPTEDDPYEEEDLTYVDVVASFFGNRFKQQHHVERIRFQVEHDALTGLVNRVQFRTAVRDTIRRGEAFAICLLDLDGFRYINERNGHETGDELLIEVAAALNLVSGRVTIARMGADEFGLVLHGTDSLDELAARIQQYLEIFRKPFRAGDRVGAHLLAVAASAGAARFPEDGSSPEDLMRRADVALELAKSRGGSTALIFDRTMESIAEEARKRVAELAEAIASDQLVLAYQPTFDLATRAIVGAEALVRWDHPERGRLPPSEFIELAERNGLIGSLSTWVCDRVARDLLSVSAFPPGFRAYINVAAELLHDIPFIATMKDALESTPRLANHLGIEVTETAAMQNVDFSMNTLDLFRSWGLTVAIDDFGTGYSSLSYLKHLTVDMIKIDRSFVTDLPDDERDCAIAQMLIHMTDRFGYASLAEGIETEAQLEWLLEHGCRFGQGYLIAKPEPFERLLERLGLTRVA